MSRTPLVLAILALGVALVALYSTFNMPSSTVPDPVRPVVHEDLEEQEEEHIELAVYMGRLQRFHQKWWAAGRAENAELAKFYLHEMEEAMEAIADGNVVENEVDVSNFMRIYGEKSIESLEVLLKEKGVKAMIAEGHVLIENCNACHVASGYPFIRIKEPEAVEFPDQVFLPGGMK